jgi:hypothetical protein
MTNSLLDRQASLLAYLVSSAAIFGDERHPSGNPALAGIDHALLHLEAVFSYDKRIAKIAAVFPKTFDSLGHNRNAMLREFAVTFPATDIDRLANACQFYDYLCTLGRPNALKTPGLLDIAACELAFAKVRSETEGGDSDVAAEKNVSQGSIRRRPGVVLHRCACDVRPIFEGESVRGLLAQRDTPLAIAIPPGADQPAVFQVAPAVFDLLAALGDWADRSSFGTTPALEKLIADLAGHGLIEVSK